MKTKLEIIDETVAYYSTHKRATDGRGCFYLYIGDEDVGAIETQCAVGRCFTDKTKHSIRQALKLTNNMQSFTHIDGFNIKDSRSNENNPEPFLKEEYKGHGVKFWRDLQKLHDNGNFWHNNGLTERGQNIVDRMKENYGS